MSCIYKYKGKDYTKDEFYSLVSNPSFIQQEQEKKFAELQERLNNKEFLEGAKNAFESSEELQQFGTQEQYNDYIARVSLGIIKNPSSGEYNYESQVKDIVYHGTNKEFDKFESDFNYYFSSNLEIAKGYSTKFTETPKPNVKSVLLNIKNPYSVNGNSSDWFKIQLDNRTTRSIGNIVRDGRENNNDGVIINNVKDGLDKTDIISNINVVFEPEQIHILGSKQDIEGFKKFINNTTEQPEPIEQYTEYNLSELDIKNPKLEITKNGVTSTIKMTNTNNLLSIDDIGDLPGLDFREALDYLFNQTVATEYNVVISNNALAYDQNILDKFVDSGKGYYQNYIFVLHDTNNITNQYYNHIENLQNDPTEQHDKSKISDNDKETIADAEQKIMMLQKALPNTTIIYDTTIDELGVVLNQNSKEYKTLAKLHNTSGPIIKVNPDKFKTDTIIHEFAHILIESYDQDIIKKLIGDLKDSELWNDVKNNYPELSEQELGKEVLATAMGLSGAELFDKLKDETLVESIIRRLELLFNRLARFLGIPPQTVRGLAMDLLYNNVTLSESPFFDKNYYSKDSFKRVSNVLDHYRKNVKLVSSATEHYYNVTLASGTVVDKDTITSGTEFIKKMFPQTNFTDLHQSKRALRKILTDPADIDKYLDKKLTDDQFKTQLEYLLTTNSAIKVAFEKAKKELNEDDEYKASSGTAFHGTLDKIVKLAIDKKPFSVDGLTVSDAEKKDLVIIYNIAANAVKKGARIETELSIYDQKNNIAGTIDLLILNPDGTVDIYDYKTYSSNYKTTNDLDTFKNYVKTRGVKNGAQLLLYKNLLESHGIKVRGVNNIIFERDVDASGVITGHNMLKKGNYPMFFDALSLTNPSQTFARMTSKEIDDVLKVNLKIKDYNNLDSQTKIINRILGDLNIRRAHLALELKKNPTSKPLASLLKIVEDLILDTTKTDKQIAIGRFLAFTGARIKSIDKVVNKFSTSSVILADAKRELATYTRLLEDIANDSSQIIQSYSPLTILNEVNRTASTVNDRIIEKTAKLLAEYSGVGQIYYKSLYEKEFLDKNRIENESGKAIVVKQSARAMGDFIQAPFKFFARIIGVEYNLFKNVKTEGSAYYLGNIKVTRDQHTAEMQKYVTTKIAENKELVDNYNYKSALVYLEHTPFIEEGLFDFLTAYLSDPRAAKDYRIRTITALADKYQSQNNQKFLDKETKLKKLAEDLNDGLFSSEAMYSKFLDNNGHVISEYKSEFVDEYYKAKDKDAWLQKNADYVTVDKKVFLVPKNHWKNPEYNGIKDDLFYKEVIKTYHDIDATTHNNTDITKKIYHNGNKVYFQTPFYKLPAVLSTVTDAITDSSGDIKTALALMKQSFVHNANDRVVNKHALTSGVSRSAYQTTKNLANRILQKQKIDKTLNKDSDYTKYSNTKHFIGKLAETREEHNKLVSKNLLKSLLLTYQDALEYRYAEDVKHDAEIIRQSGLITSYDKSNIGVLTGNNDVSLAEYSKTKNFQRLENVIAQKVYRVRPGNDVKGMLVPLVKGFDTILTFTYMGLNYFSNLMNFYMGNYDSKMLAIGLGVYNVENLENAKEYINKHATTEIADSLRYTPKAKTNLLLREFGLQDVYSKDYKNKSVLKSVLKKLNPSTALFELDSIVKHYVDTNILVSVMDSYKALDVNGDYLTKEGVATKDVKQAAGIEHFYITYVKVLKGGVESEIQKDKVTDEKIISEPYLKINPIVKSTNKVSLDNLNNKIRYTTVNAIRLATGNYENNNASMLGMSVFGMVFEKFRKWIAPGVENRFSGWNNLKKKEYTTFSESQIFYDGYLDNIKDGYYTTFLKYIFYNQATRDNLLIGLLSKMHILGDTEYNKTFSQLDQNELDNIKRTMYDITTISLSILTVMLLKAMNDDDEEEIPYQIIVLYRRLYMERASLTPTPMGFWEMFKVLRDPIPGASWIEDMWKLGDYIWAFEDNDFYKNTKEGHYEEGEWKGWNHLKRLTPGYRMWSKDLKAYLQQLEEPK
jgi:hypothetical protein